MDWEDHEKLTESYALDIICNQSQLNFQPGEQFQYTNSGYFLLGIIVKRVGGMTLREFAKQHIFDPLEMNSTHFHDDHKMIVKNRACGYSQRDDGGFELAMSKTEIVGDGCVFSTIEDLAKWANNFHDNKLDGGRELMKRFLTPGKLNNGDSTQYAFGVMVVENFGLTNIWHGGGYAGYGALVDHYPEERFTYIILTNVIDYLHPNIVNSTVTSIKFPQDAEQKEPAQEEEETFITLNVDDLEKFVGMYVNPRGWMFSISKEESDLFMDVVGWKKFRTSYAPISPNRIKPVEGKFDFILEIEEPECEKSKKVTLISPRIGPMPCEVIDFTISNEQMKEYEGAFYNEDIKATYILHVEQDGLFCKFPSLPPKDYNLFTFSQDVFVWAPIPNEFVKLKFIRSEGGKVTGFWLDAPKHVSNFKFEKQD
jgi:hypothetical protein